MFSRNIMDIQRASYVGLLIFGWYSTSISLGMYNTYLFSSNHYDFHFPFLVTMMHSAIHFALSSTVLKYLKSSLKPARYPTIMEYTLKIGPCALATATDIGLSNSSLKVFLKLTVDNPVLLYHDQIWRASVYPAIRISV